MSAGLTLPQLIERLRADELPEVRCWASAARRARDHGRGLLDPWIRAGYVARVNGGFAITPAGLAVVRELGEAA